MPFLRTRCSQRLIFEYWRNFLLPNTPDCVPRIKFRPVFAPSKFEPLSTSRSPSCCSALFIGLSIRSTGPGQFFVCLTGLGVGFLIR